MIKQKVIAIIGLVCILSFMTGCKEQTSEDLKPGTEIVKPETEDATTTTDADEPIMEDASGEVPTTDAVVTKTFVAHSEVYSSVDGQSTVQIIRFEGDAFDSVRLTTGDVVKDMLVEGYETSQIMGVEWINNNAMIAITSHINPYVNQYLTIDLTKAFEQQMYYGFGFTWNTAFTHMYYIQAFPGSSDEAVDTLMDEQSNILFQSSPGMRLQSGFEFTEDGQVLALEILSVEDESHWNILRAQSDGTYRIVATLMDSESVPEFVDNDTLKVTKNGVEELLSIKDFE